MRNMMVYEVAAIASIATGLEVTSKDIAYSCEKLGVAMSDSHSVLDAPFGQIVLTDLLNSLVS